MAEIKLYDLDPNETMEIVRDLRSKGLAQGIHFDFAYHQGVWDYFTNDETVRKHTKFTFYEGSEKWATWLALKYNQTK